MASVFKNPLSSPVGQRLNTAVSHGQSSVDYPIVMEMCDIINDTDHGPKDAKAAFKKILFLNKDAGQVLQCLHILDICIKNGQKRFHRQIITKDFVMDLAKLAQGGKSTHSAVRERSLLLIQSWADTYRGKEDMGVAAEIYDQLKSSGVEFPAVNLDDIVPVNTPPSRQPAVSQPPATQPAQPNLPFSPQASYPRQPIPQNPTPQNPIPQNPYPPQQQQRPQYAPQGHSGPPRGLSGEQIAKILSELDVVQTNVQVLSDLMLNSVPGQDRQDDMDFMQNLKDTIQRMQARVMDLLNSPHAEDITARLLQLNDDINNVFTRYERFQRQTQAASNPNSSQRTIQIPEEPAPVGEGISYPFLQSTTPTQLDPPSRQLEDNLNPSPAAPPPADPIADLMLLDFGTSSTAPNDTPLIPAFPQQNPTSSPALASSGTAATGEGLDEFDIFAKSRQSTYASEFDTTSYSDTTQQPSTTITKALHPRAISPEDATGLTEWLAATDLTTSKVDAPAQGDLQTTSEDFDKFLEERANAPYVGGRSNAKAKKNKDKTPTPDEMFSL